MWAGLSRQSSSKSQCFLFFKLLFFFFSSYFLGVRGKLTLSLCKMSKYKILQNKGPLHLNCYHSQRMALAEYPKSFLVFFFQPHHSQACSRGRGWGGEGGRCGDKENSMAVLGRMSIRLSIFSIGLTPCTCSVREQAFP